MPLSSLSKSLRTFGDRHRIARQVVAADIVGRAQEYVDHALPSPLCHDIRIMSFSGDTLTVGAKSAAARGAFRVYLDVLAKDVAAGVGLPSVQILCRLAPGLWEDRQ
jgi:hypothetical protein